MNAGIVTYRKNSSYDDHAGADQPRLYAELDLSQFGVDIRIPRLPVFYQVLSNPIGPVRVIYTTHIAGLSFEAGNLNRLENIITSTVKALIRFECLPGYVFRVGESAWPIYQLQDELVTRYPGGPVFNAPDIGSLRIWLAEHFKELGRIHNRREMDLLALSPFDLQLYAPVFVLRTPGETVPDVSIFPMPGEKVLQLNASVQHEKISLPLDQPGRIFEVQAVVGERLVHRGVLNNPLESTIRKLSLDYWEALLDTLSPSEQSLAYTRSRDGVHFRHILPIYHSGSMLVAGRVNRVNRVVLYRAASLEELVQRVSQDLHYYGAINSPGEVRTQAAGQLTSSPVFQAS